MRIKDWKKIKDNLREKIAEIIGKSYNLDCGVFMKSIDQIAEEILALPEFQEIKKIKKIWNEDCQMVGDSFGVIPKCQAILEDVEVKEEWICEHCQGDAIKYPVCEGCGNQRKTIIRRPAEWQDILYEEGKGFLLFNRLIILKNIWNECLVCVNKYSCTSCSNYIWVNEECLTTPDGGRLVLKKK